MSVCSSTWYPQSKVAMDKRDQLRCGREENRPVHYLRLAHKAVVLSLGTRSVCALNKAKAKSLNLLGSWQRSDHRQGRDNSK